MTNHYFKSMLLAAFALVCGMANAQDIKAPVGDKLADGKVYAIQNVNKSSAWMIRTSWDGALYMPKDAKEENAVQVTAHANADGSWSFTVAGTEGVEWLCLPEGSGNVNAKAEEEWPVEGVQPAFNCSEIANGVYRIVVAEGNNPKAVGYNVHMNSGNEYVVASYLGNGWYPDFYGGTLKDEYDEPVYVNPDDENDERVVMADSTTCNWYLVDVENIAGYMAKAVGYGAIKAFYNRYVDEEEYAAGMQATCEVLCALYNGEEFYAEELEQLQAIIAAKNALYEEIELAIEANDAGDAVLTSAIASAKAIFNNSSNPRDLENATETLREAVNNYTLGTGDLTGLGRNMSFEDLSAQNGQQTSGVGPAPAGWNIYINGDQVTTADEVRAKGFSAWHGVNNDAEGEVMDGSYAFGIWNSAVPTYEISQTIEGLENGTYTITAGLMVGANGSGSRRTTQRIFGNIHSTYFGSADEYNEALLDQSEVYGFQGNEEPVTDRLLQPIQVKAYVYDGTLTFGLRTDGNYQAANRTNSNGAGGDGWFKLDNFRIVKDGFDPDVALDILNYFSSKLDAYLANSDYKIYPSLILALEQVMDRINDITVESDVQLINSSIMAASGIIGDVNASVLAYARLFDVITEMYVKLEEYETKQGAGEFSDAIMVVEEKWDNCEYNSEAEINAAIQELQDALQACIESDAIEEGSDLSFYIRNNSFEDLSAQNNVGSGGIVNAPAGWTLVMDGEVVSTAAEITAHLKEGWCAINNGDNIEVEYNGEVYTHQYTDGDHLWGIWTKDLPSVEISQTLSLPAGLYRLEADVVVEHNWANISNITTQRLFANNYVQMWGRDYDYADNFTDDMTLAQAMQEAYKDSDQGEHLSGIFTYAGHDNDVRYDYTSIAHPMSIVFPVGADGVAKIGFRTNNVYIDGTPHHHDSSGWFKLDNFRLTCERLGSFFIPEVPDAIATVSADKAQDNSIYDLTGRKINNPARGIYIVGGKKMLVK